jgi:hypothetical protein
MSEPKTIKPLEDYKALSDKDLVARLTAVYNGMNGNANFPTPPVDPKDLKAGIDAFDALIAESLDGSKKVMAQKRKQRAAVIRMVRHIGRYVEVTCKDDMAIFMTSGLQPASTTRNPKPPLSHAIRWIDRGSKSGEVLVQLKGNKSAISHDLRYAPIVNGATPTTWTEELVTNVKRPVVLDGLTPGTNYAFQVRATEKTGRKDWSDSVTFICA